MKVTFLTWEYPPHIYGGAGFHVKYLIQALEGQVDIEVRTLKARGRAVKGNIKLMEYQPWNFVRLDCDPRFKTLFEALSLDLALIKDPIDADIVHSHTWYTSLAGFLARNLYEVKFVATVHSLEPRRPWKEEVMGRAYRLSTWAERTALESCDRIIAVSREMKRNIMECYDIEEELIEVIPNGIDIKTYRKREVNSVLERYGIYKPYVLFLGRLSRQKGIFDLIEASKEFPAGVSLVLVTGRPDEQGLKEELIEEIRDRKKIIWIDKMLTEEEKVALYSCAEVFACPSIYEPFGIVNLEAMACETPVVSTLVGGIIDVVVDGETGLLVSPGKPEEITEAVNRILSNKDLAHKMGKRGRERVEREFSWERVADKTLALYKALI